MRAPNGQKIPPLCYKVILLGDSGVGKTSLIRRFTKSEFVPTKSTVGIDFVTKTYQIEQFTIILNIFDTAGQEMYDSLARSYYKGADAAIFVFSLVKYLQSSIFSKSTFDNLPKWISQFIKMNRNSQQVKILVGTKKDLLRPKTQIEEIEPITDVSETLVSETEKKDMKKSPFSLQKQRQQKYYQLNPEMATKDEVKEIVEKEKLMFSFETSAKLNENIDAVFEELGRNLLYMTLKKKKTENILKEEELTVWLQSGNKLKLGNEQRSSGCCGK